MDRHIAIPETLWPHENSWHISPSASSTPNLLPRCFSRWSFSPTFFLACYFFYGKVIFFNWPKWSLGEGSAAVRCSSGHNKWKEVARSVLELSFITCLHCYIANRFVLLHCRAHSGLILIFPILEMHFLFSLIILLLAALAQAGGGSSTKYAVKTPPLTTPWTDAVGTDPWPEYPRPQLQRSEWLSLNGIWTYQNASSLDSLSSPPFGQVLANEVLVPSCLESGLSG